MKRSLLPLALLMFVTGCVTNPATGEADFVLMSEEEEITRGRKYDEEIRKQYAVLDDTNLQAYVHHVGRKLAAVSHRPKLDYSFTVLDSPEVNAFALPGGFVYITRGMLAYLNSEAELAAVLGHEIGHVTARHAVRQHSGSTATGMGVLLLTLVNPLAAVGLGVDRLGEAMVRGYGREHELESDRLGAVYMARAGYDPDAMIKVIGVLKNQEEFEKERAQAENRAPRNYHGVFATHPDNDKRLQEVVAEAGRLHAEMPVTPKDDIYLLHIDGLLFGENPRNGVVLGNRFVRPDLDLVFTFPEGWRLMQHRTTVVAVNPQRNALIRLQIEQRPTQSTPAEHLRDRPGIPALDRELAFTVPQGPGHSAVVNMHTPFGRKRSHVIAIYHREHLLLFLGTAKNDADFDNIDAQTMAIARDARKLSGEERSRANGQKIRIDITTPGLTFAKLAARLTDDAYAESRLRLVNDKYPYGEFAVGDRFKRIE
jgi:predicted Zn-dependent protease